MQGKTRIDVVDEFAFPLPVTVICKVLGVPLEAIPRFHGWIESGPGRRWTSARRRPTRSSSAGWRRVAEAGGRVRAVPGRPARPVPPSSPARACSRRWSTTTARRGACPRTSLVSNAMLLLFAGHETTVNLIAHSVLTLLRHPDALEKLRRRPELIVPGVEELLRFESSVQFWHTRSAARGHRDRRHHHPEGRADLPGVRLGEPRPGAVREPRRARPRTPGQPARRLQPGHPLLLRRPARAAGGPDRGRRVRPPRGEPAARRGPAAVPPQPDLPRPAPPPGRHRRDPRLTAASARGSRTVRAGPGSSGRSAGAVAPGACGTGRRGGGEGQQSASGPSA